MLPLRRLSFVPSPHFSTSCTHHRLHPPPPMCSPNAYFQHLSLPI
uniref:Uncharacterized protein n=1 Tax=Arundo donax TaxID=35708 RepID=A0A0A8YLN6_ARUDO